MRWPQAAPTLSQDWVAAAVKRKTQAAPIPPAIAVLIVQIHRIADQELLPKPVRLEVVSALDHAIIPRRTPGPKNERTDLAYKDYRAGVRGLELYRKHIPNFGKLSRWRRAVEQNRLLKALQKRAERERKREHPPTVSLDELSPRQPQCPNGHSDNPE